jgi:hypothetical protein
LKYRDIELSSCPDVEMSSELAELPNPRSLARHYTHQQIKEVNDLNPRPSTHLLNQQVDR